MSEAPTSPIPFHSGHAPAAGGRDTGQSRPSVIPPPTGPAWLTWQQVGERVARSRPACTALGVQPGGPGRDPVQHPGRVGPRRPRHPVRRRGHHHGVPDDRARGRRLHPRRLRLPGAHRRERRPRSPRSPAPTLPALTHIVLIDGRPRHRQRAGRSRLAELEQRGAAALAADPDLVDRIAQTRSARTTSPR